jgi:hypothetical protein
VTRGTRPKKSSSSRGFAREARGARGVWGFWGFWRLKTEFFILLYFFSRIRADVASGPHGQQTTSAGKGGGEGGRGEAREGMRALTRTPMSARTLERVRTDAVMRSHGGIGTCSRTQCFTPGNFKTVARVRPSHGRPCGHRPTVRPSVRPSVIVRVTTLISNNKADMPCILSCKLWITCSR